MASGPIEIVVFEFTGKFTGAILPELERLVAAGTVSIVDGLFARKSEDGDVELIEIAEVSDDEEAAALAGVMDRVDGLVSDEDVEDLTAGIAPGTAAAILVFEHTWVIPLRDAITAAGGTLVENIRIPGPVVDEILATVPDED
ncbi:DUF6325 family protein [Agromyces mangrovi Wang et al. 2018]|uniref:DUF6325 family protein n=1 Tax=Agromyces mangrovi TaxID=1858653 RepID=UPI002572A773|nr:DUF6325 family protein [Agromyces mangrovi]BDZ64290.1 DUF1269 domain-containing family protein [Agromyces mangrovi]